MISVTGRIKAAYSPLDEEEAMALLKKLNEAVTAVAKERGFHCTVTGKVGGGSGSLNLQIARSD